MKKIVSFAAMTALAVTLAFAAGDGKKECSKTCEKGAACCAAHGNATASANGQKSCCQGDKSKCNKDKGACHHDKPATTEPAKKEEKK
ncbi:MAG: hypothetical protein U0T84_10550 [Chitinophagales bacterium]